MVVVTVVIVLVFVVGFGGGDSHDSDTSIVRGGCGSHNDDSGCDGGCDDGGGGQHVGRSGSDWLYLVCTK